MPQIRFTANLQRHLEVPELIVTGDTVAEAFQQVFLGNPRLRSYLLDDQGSVRQHVAVFVDAKLIADRTHLSDAVKPDSEIYVVQALSGG